MGRHLATVLLQHFRMTLVLTMETVYGQANKSKYLNNEFLAFSWKFFNFLFTYIHWGGVQRVHLLKCNVARVLLKELFQRDGVGTKVASDLYERMRMNVGVDDNTEKVAATIDGSAAPLPLPPPPQEPQ
ncbi:probable amino-acid acetyltransferase NAGS1, chloroplastic isoform X1 [Tanacetum coccineum]|uniref:Probable amino-acid acetyltransferase NAGS1, chloroplastic isoform X1 n=1 Tax=Tanacetum coccineum TaxID=301880 RepID=A0ABQ4XUC2_9ASTR